MEAVNLTITGDPVAARDAAAAALSVLKFSVQWHDAWSATAERGNKLANALAGALAQYFKVELKLFSADAGTTVVQLKMGSKGYMGGAIGVHRTKKNMQRLRDDLAAQFQEQGILVGVTEV